MSIIKAAERYAEMEKSGLTIAQISAKTGTDSAAIQDRLQLLTLTPDEQDKVKNNKMSYVQALKICEHRNRAGARLKANDAARLHANDRNHLQTQVAELGDRENRNSSHLSSTSAG